MARQGGFKQCCPSAACEGSLGGQRGQGVLLESHIPCSGLSASRSGWEPSTWGGLSGLAAACACHRPTAYFWELDFMFLPTRRAHRLPPLPLSSQTTRLLGTPLAMQPLHARFWAGTGRNTRQVGWGPAWFLFSQPWKLRAIPLILMRLRWYEPEGTRSVAEFGLCCLMAQPE